MPIMGKCRTVILVALSLVCLREVVAQGSSSEPSSSLTISAAQDSVKLGSPVVVKVVCKNISSHVIQVAAEIHNHDLLVDVRDASGTLMPDTPLGSLYNGHRNPDMVHVTPEDLHGNAVYRSLKGGESFTREVNIANRYDLTHTGKYTVQVQRADAENPSLTVKSNTIAVTLVP